MEGWKDGERKEEEGEEKRGGYRCRVIARVKNKPGNQTEETEETEQGGACLWAAFISSGYLRKVQPFKRKKEKKKKKTKRLRSVYRSPPHSVAESHRFIQGWPSLAPFNRNIFSFSVWLESKRSCRPHPLHSTTRCCPLDGPTSSPSLLSLSLPFMLLLLLSPCWLSIDVDIQP